MNQIVVNELLGVVDKQLREGNPPETHETYVRLLEAGYSDEDARMLIVQALLAEVYEVLKSKKPYNHERYVAALAKLPDLP